MNLLGTGMRFDFPSSLGIGRETSKYMRIEDGECKTHLSPASLSCLPKGVYFNHLNVPLTITIICVLIHETHFTIKINQANYFLNNHINLKRHP